jgi:hypothetical protein
MTGSQVVVGIGMIVLASCVVHPKGGPQAVQSPAQMHSRPLRLSLTQVQDSAPPSFLHNFTNPGKQPLILSMGSGWGRNTQVLFTCY